MQTNSSGNSCSSVFDRWYVGQCVALRGGHRRLKHPKKYSFNSSALPWPVLTESPSLFEVGIVVEFLLFNFLMDFQNSFTFEGFRFLKYSSLQDRSKATTVFLCCLYLARSIACSQCACTTGRATFFYEWLNQKSRVDPGKTFIRDNHRVRNKSMHDAHKLFLPVSPTNIHIT